MVTRSYLAETLEDLRDYVNDTLCQIDQLEYGAFPLTERLLLRGGAPCGVYFCLHGPRSMKLVAIWDAALNLVLFYGANGQRLQRTQLSAGPPLPAPRAAA